MCCSGGYFQCQKKAKRGRKGDTAQGSGSRPIVSETTFHIASSHHAASYHLHISVLTAVTMVILHAMCKIAGCNCALSAQLIMDGVAPTNDLLLPISLLENDGILYCVG
mmetsp:Transcript_19835/g.33551  ORF Transcript_19835/g.33551 Transcript_19835/m.33551 type:complete len:109 (-) Transcript_19835:40-366(-)